MSIGISFVVPVMNEAASLRELFFRIQSAVTTTGYSWELLFIDDGSTDETWSVIQALHKEHPEQIRAIRFSCNLGKTRALEDGFRFANGEIVFTLDGDLQDDPQEIPRFLAKLEEGYDLVSGWKQVRHDAVVKVISSRLFNGAARIFLGLHIHDINCGFKCYRRAVVQALPLYGQMHRVIPGLAAVWGFRVGEIAVRHHARQFGESKFGKLGIMRIIPGYIDLASVFAFRCIGCLPFALALYLHELLLLRSAPASMFLIRETLPAGSIPLWERYCKRG